MVIVPSLTQRIQDLFGVIHIHATQLNESETNELNEPYPKKNIYGFVTKRKAKGIACVYELKLEFLANHNVEPHTI